MDEAHESSLRIGDLIGLLTVPIDRSFKTPADAAMPRLEPGEPVFVAEGLKVEFRSPGGAARRALDGLSVAIRHGETIGVAGRSGCGKTTWLRALMRLAHPCGGDGDPGRRPAGAGQPQGDRRAGRLRRPEPLPLRRHRRPEHRLRLRRAPPRSDPPRRRDGLHPRRDHDDARRLSRPGRRARPEPLRRPEAADRPGPGLPQGPADPDPRRGDIAPWTTPASGWSRRRSTPPGPIAP